MKKIYKTKRHTWMRSNFLALVTLCCLSIYAFNLNAQVKFKQEVHITDDVLFFDGKKVSAGAPNSTTGYDYIYGNSVSPRGDCIKTYKHFIIHL